MASNTPPPAPVGDGRDPRGKFTTGNRAGKGNPLAKQAQALRVELFNAVSPADLRAIVHKLVAMAKAGDLGAAREVLERVLGRPVEHDLLERLDQLEALIDKPPHHERKSDGTE